MVRKQKEKKEKVPFKMLSKKALCAFLSVAVMASSAGLLTGCAEKGDKGDTGAPGLNGTNGATWYSGTQYDASQGVVGDFFYDTDDFKIYKKNEGGWYLISTIKSSVSIDVAGYWVIDGVTTEVKAKGENGEPAETPYIRNGNWWVGEEDLGIKATGDEGKSAYDLALEEGFEGNQAEWLASLKGEKGDSGKDGATWLTGTAITGTGTEISATITGSKVGDLYFNTDTCDIYQCTAENTWKWITNIKGQTGPQGPQGEKGEDGTSVYVGYDGYIWNGTTRTDLGFTALGESVAENTIELYNNKYFTTSTISAGAKVALMANYMPNAKLTQYSGTTITELTTYVSNAGKLDIGVVNLSTGAYTLKQIVDVEADKNVLTLDIEVAEGETLVLGGDNTTVDLFKSSGVEADDEFGLFSTDLTNFTLSQTEEVNDKLIVNVKCQIKSVDEIAAVENVQSYLTTISSSTDFNRSSCPFAYSHADRFANKTISKIGVPVKTLTDNTQDQIFTVFVIKQSTTSNFATNYVSKHELIIPANTYTSTTVNAWHYFDTTGLNLTLAEDESLAFFASTDTVLPGYVQTANDTFKFYTSTGSLVSSSLLIDVYFKVADYEDFSSSHIEKLEQKEAEAILENQKQALATALSGKNFSILGDSISTFTGVSNDSTNTNSTIGSNAVWYDTELAVDQTWWSQIADVTDMNILVNNSYSGDTVSNAKTSRCVNLHDNTGNAENGVINPDIIAVYMGVNDIKNNASLSVETFKSNYLTMIQNMKNAYADSDIFLFTIPQYTYGSSRTDEELNAYNEAIREIATAEGCKVVDLFANSGITKSNLGIYTIDNLHPNAEGMDLITECFWNVLYETYVTNANN